MSTTFNKDDGDLPAEEDPMQQRPADAAAVRRSASSKTENTENTDATDSPRVGEQESSADRASEQLRAVTLFDEHEVWCCWLLASGLARVLLGTAFFGQRTAAVSSCSSSGPDMLCVRTHTHTNQKQPSFNTTGWQQAVRPSGAAAAGHSRAPCGVVEAALCAGGCGDDNSGAAVHPDRYWAADHDEGREWAVLRCRVESVESRGVLKERSCFNTPLLRVT